MPDSTAVLILLPFLAAAIERAVEVVMGPFGAASHKLMAPTPLDPHTTLTAEQRRERDAVEKAATEKEGAVKRLLGLGFAFILAAVIAFGLDLDLIRPLLGGLDGDTELSADEAKWLTAIALAGGSAPAHELIRLVEEAKKKMPRPEQ